MSKKITIPCPECGQVLEWKSENPFRPFCSERCKLIDLGEWATESRRIPAEPIDPNPEDIDPEENA